MEERRELQLRRLLANWYELAVLGCLLLAAVGGAAAYTAHVDPGTETVQQPTAEWTTAGEYDHAAAVSRENPLFEQGVVLSNRNTYFTRLTPVLDGSYRFAYDAPDGDVTVSLRSTLVIQSVGGDGETYWQRSRSLDAFEREGVPPGRTIRLPFSVNVSAVTDEIKEIESAVGGSPGQVEIRIRTTATYDGVVDGEGIRRSRTDSLVITPSASTYGVETGENSGGQREASVTTTETVPREYGPTRSLGGPLALLVGMALGAALLALDPDALGLSTAERERLTFFGDRAEYEAWLSGLEPSESTLATPPAEAESLADLVEYAIDADRGVVAEPGTDPPRYHVDDGDSHYVYEAPPASASRSATDLLRPEVADALDRASDDE